MRYRKPARFVTKPLAQARDTPKSAPARLQLALLDPQVARELRIHAGARLVRSRRKCWSLKHESRKRRRLAA
jgi:hypothetical protein